MRWSEAVTLEFVKIYLKHECLWNPLHPGYKLKYQREKAYNDIALEFKASTMKTLSVLEVKLKIKNLRTTYVQQIHKILEKSSPDSIYEPSLIWFNEMDRCLKHVSSNRHSSSYSSSQEHPEVDSSSQIWVEQQLPSAVTEEIHPDPLIPQTDDENEVSKPEKPSARVKRERRQSPLSFKRSKKKKSKHRSQAHEYSTDSNSEIAPKDCSAVKEDEFDIYGKYIASQLRNMDLKKALRLQLEFQSLPNEYPEVDSCIQIWKERQLPSTTTESHPDYLMSQSLSKPTEPFTMVKRERKSSPVCFKRPKKKKPKRRSKKALDFSTDSNSEIVLKEIIREDEFDIYGKYIASQLRSMDLKKALRLQLEFQNHVIEARISDLASRRLMQSNMERPTTPGTTTDANPDHLIQSLFKPEEPSNKVKKERKSSPTCFKSCKRKKSKRKNKAFEYSTDSNSEIAVKESTTAKEDEFDIYGKYIASQLRNMNLKKALRLQLEFQGIVSEARISELGSDE